MLFQEFIKNLKKIEFRTRMKSREAISGAYHSAFKGRGMTFSECKPYEEGDDVRYIDWHASAREQGVFVKQFEEERELSVYIVLDLTPSMQFGSVGRTKAETAIEAMSYVAFSALFNNDKAGELLFNGSHTKFIPQVKGKANTVRFIVEALKFCKAEADMAPCSASALNTAIIKTMTLLKRKSLIFIISDFLHPGFEISLQHLSHRHEVIPLVISDPMEREMPDMGLTVLRDSTHRNMMLADCSNRQYRQDYTEQFDSRAMQQAEIFRRCKLMPVCISTTSDILAPIERAFDRRSNHA